MVRFLRNRGSRPRKDEVVCREVITLEDPTEELQVDDVRVQREIRNLMKDQQPGRYRVQVRRRVVRQ
jgi:hypothetical protein